MRKIKLYLDTSVISHIDAPHKPEAEATTHAFYKFLEEHSDEYELYISPVVELEVRNCPGEKKHRLLALIDQMKMVQLPESREALGLADLYVKQKVLAMKHIRDLSHVAYATVARCDFVVSWNMKHLANPQTIVRANAVNRLNNYCDTSIVTPLIIIGESYDAGT